MIRTFFRNYGALLAIAALWILASLVAPR